MGKQRVILRKLRSPFRGCGNKRLWHKTLLSFQIVAWVLPVSVLYFFSILPYEFISPTFGWRNSGGFFLATMISAVDVLLGIGLGSFCYLLREYFNLGPLGLRVAPNLVWAFAWNALGISLIGFILVLYFEPLSSESFQKLQISLEFRSAGMLLILPMFHLAALRRWGDGA